MQLAHLLAHAGLIALEAPSWAVHFHAALDRLDKLVNALRARPDGSTYHWEVASSGSWIWTILTRLSVLAAGLGQS